MKRIICVGNRFKPEDSAGPLVYDQLLCNNLPKNVEVIDGGLAGLDLLCFINDTDRLVFVDTVNGFGSSDGVLVLTAEDAAKNADTVFGHGAGLAYCLRVLPEIHDGKIPKIFIVGVEGKPDPNKISKAADMSLGIAIQGKP